MKPYYIEIESQGFLVAIVKVEADSFEQAEYKALKALHCCDDIYQVSEDLALTHAKEGCMGILDEDGCEI